jgi:hypothetical protein
MRRKDALELRLRYPNASSLRAAWQNGLQHGGCVLPGAVEGLEANASVRLVLVLDQERHAINARSGQSVPGAGRMLVFESEEAVAGLGAWIDGLPDDEGPVSAPELEPGDRTSDEPEDVASLALDGSGWVAAPGTVIPIYVVKFATIRSFERHGARWKAEGRAELPFDEREAETGAPARLRLVLPGHNVFELPAWVDTARPTLCLRLPVDHAEFRKAILHPDSAMGRTRKEREEDAEEAPEILRLSEEVPEPKPQIPLRRRIRQMGVEEKINLALSGDREARMTLASDTNRAIHHYLLKNQRITADEVAFMARQPTLNPDVLLKIAENSQYTQNQQVVKGLVLNPKTPLSIAIRLLDRLPRSDLMALSRRTNMHKRLVMAAKKKLSA